MATTTITKSELIRQVRVVLDMNESNSILAGLQDTNQLQVDDIIEQCLQYAFDRVLDQAPLWMIPELLDKKKSTVTKRKWGAGSTKNYGKKCDAPDNMYRPVSVMCDDWEQAVYEFTDKTSQRYVMQKSEFGGIRGNQYEPVVVLTHDPTNPDNHKLYFEIYDTTLSTAENADNSAWITYIKRLDVSSSMSIPSLILQSIVYTTANLYYVTLGDEKMAQMMAAEALESLSHNRVEDPENGK